MMKRIVVSEYLQDEFVGRLRRACDVVYDPDLYSSPGELYSALAGAHAIFIRNRTRIDQALLASARELQVVGRLGVGLDNIDMAACERAGVEVIPAVGANAVSVAEYVLGAMLVLSRPVYSLTQSMLDGSWPRQGHAFGRELSGKTLGLIGFGSIARHVARLATAVGMQVVAHDPYVPASDPAWSDVGRLDLTALIATADIVSIHTNLNDETRGMINRETLVRFKQGAILINTARGGIVDERALADALRSGALGGAAIDVFESEPLGPEPASTFDGIANLILTPHVAGNTEESVHRVAMMVVDAVMDALGV